MHILLLYISPNKTTEKISRALCERFTQAGHRVSLLNIGKAENQDFSRLEARVYRGIDILGIGGPVYHLKLLHPLEAYLKKMLPNLAPSTRAFITLTYGGISSGLAFSNTLKLLEQNQIELVGALKVWAPHFYNPAPYPDSAALESVAAFCTRLEETRFATISWERAGRMFATQSTAVKIVYPLTGLIGHLRELPIEFDLQKCAQCGRCERECPVHAIELNPYPERNRERCLYCYHCTLACPKGAVLCPTAEVEKQAQLNKKIIGCEQPRNQVFL